MRPVPPSDEGLFLGEVRFPTWARGAGLWDPTPLGPPTIVRAEDALPLVAVREGVLLGALSTVGTEPSPRLLSGRFVEHEALRRSLAAEDDAALLPLAWTGESMDRQVLLLEDLPSDGYDAVSVGGDGGGNSGATITGKARPGWAVHVPLSMMPSGESSFPNRSGCGGGSSGAGGAGGSAFAPAEALAPPLVCAPGASALALVEQCMGLRLDAKSSAFEKALASATKRGGGGGGLAGVREHHGVRVDVEVRVGASAPSLVLSFAPVPPVPLLPTPLSQHLLGRLGAPLSSSSSSGSLLHSPVPLSSGATSLRTGFLTMHETRRAVLLLDSDAQSILRLPLIGIWVSGLAGRAGAEQGPRRVAPSEGASDEAGAPGGPDAAAQQLRHPLVWAAAHRFLCARHPCAGGGEAGVSSGGGRYLGGGGRRGTFLVALLPDSPTAGALNNRPRFFEGSFNAELGGLGSDLRLGPSGEFRGDRDGGAGLDAPVKCLTRQFHFLADAALPEPEAGGGSWLRAEKARSGSRLAFVGRLRPTEPLAPPAPVALSASANATARAVTGQAARATASAHALRALGPLVDQAADSAHRALHHSPEAARAEEARTDGQRTPPPAARAASAFGRRANRDEPLPVLPPTSPAATWQSAGRSSASPPAPEGAPRGRASPGSSAQATIEAQRQLIEQQQRQLDALRHELAELRAFATAAGGSTGTTAAALESPATDAAISAPRALAAPGAVIGLRGASSPPNASKLPRSSGGALASTRARTAAASSQPGRPGGQQSASTTELWPGGSQGFDERHLPSEEGSVDFKAGIGGGVEDGEVKSRVGYSEPLDGSEAVERSAHRTTPPRSASPGDPHVPGLPLPRESPWTSSTLARHEWSSDEDLAVGPPFEPLRAPSEPRTGPGPDSGPERRVGSRRLEDFGSASPTPTSVSAWGAHDDSEGSTNSASGSTSASNTNSPFQGQHQHQKHQQQPAASTLEGLSAGSAPAAAQSPPRWSPESLSFEVPRITSFGLAFGSAQSVTHLAPAEDTSFVLGRFGDGRSLEEASFGSSHSASVSVGARHLMSDEAASVMEIMNRYRKK